MVPRAPVAPIAAAAEGELRSCEQAVLWRCCFRSGRHLLVCSQLPEGCRLSLLDSPPSLAGTRVHSSWNPEHSALLGPSEQDLVQLVFQKETHGRQTMLETGVQCSEPLVPQSGLLHVSELKLDVHVKHLTKCFPSLTNVPEMNAF